MADNTEFPKSVRIGPIIFSVEFVDGLESEFRSFAGFGSAASNAAYATGFRANSNRSGTTPAHDWMHYPDQIKFYIERLQGVTVENRPAAEVILQHDGPKTLYYIDPPYPHETRNMARGNAAYACEMTDDEHCNLSDLLHHVKGYVIISSYPSPMYDELYSTWRRETRQAHADGAAARIETLWMNFDPPNRLF